jgi:hypothetical protein
MDEPEIKDPIKTPKAIAPPRKNGKKTTTRDLPEFINENKTTRYKR